MIALFRWFIVALLFGGEALIFPAMCMLNNLPLRSKNDCEVASSSVEG